MIDPLLIGALRDLLEWLGVGGTSAIAVIILITVPLYGRKALKVGDILGSWLTMLMFASAVVGALILLGIFPEVRVGPLERLLAELGAALSEWLPKGLG